MTVLEHAEREETEEFTLFEAHLSDDELAKLTTAVEVAERIAPTHPHPGVESAFANVAAESRHPRPPPLSAPPR